ncbi:MAG: hypothetical protein IJ072_08595 [Oscillospiraceae bacterium]|nr:hypothetical protein [Oscillospiraceae bacterium]
MDMKENYLAFLNHENTQWIPGLFTDVYICGGNHETFENGPAEGGEDGFGVLWIPTHSTSGQGVPAANHIVLEDVTTWEDVVRFPDLDAFDWEEYARQQLAGKEKRDRVLEYHAWNSQFLRLTHLMGFENALCALYEEPEACEALLTAITDYKIRLIERVHDYFHPDSFVNYDDVATERGLFMSPAAYREYIKPQHKRMNDAVRALGMIPQQHCCGYCQDIISDFIDEGSAAWQSAQPSNDISMILETYGDRIGVTGGYDTQGHPGTPAATVEEIYAEVDRCIEQYGRYGRSYCFMGLLLAETGDDSTNEKFGAMVTYAAQRGRKS